MCNCSCCRQYPGLKSDTSSPYKKGDFKDAVDNISKQIAKILAEKNLKKQIKRNKKRIKAEFKFEKQSAISIKKSKLKAK